MKFFKRIELYAMWAMYPIATMGTIWASYRLFIWSFGGKECFRYAVIREPQEQGWVKANPRNVLGRDAPLSQIPQYLETPGHAAPTNGSGQPGNDHNHHNNY